MLWLRCKQRDHRWRTHRHGFELAYWECRRWFCKAKRKAPWYIAYQEFHGYGHKPPSMIDGPYSSPE